MLDCCQRKRGQKYWKSRQRQYKSARVLVRQTLSAKFHTSDVLELQDNRDPLEWIVDTCADAYITSFEERLSYYVEFQQKAKSKGVGSKLVAALKNTLKEVVYVPENSDQILSLMKLRRETSIGFYFTGLEGFVLAAPNPVKPRNCEILILNQNENLSIMRRFN